MQEEVSLSSVLNDSKKASFISVNQITLNYCDIELIDKISPRFLNITKLFLSHNKISSLTGIEQFNFLTYLSIGYNQIAEIKELNKISNKENLKFLMIQGNPLEKHPNYKVLVLEMFPNLEILNETKIDQNFRNTLEKKTSNIQKNLITFLYFLFDEINNIEILKNKLKISKELKGFLFDKKEEIINAQDKLNKFMDSQKNLGQFKNLFNFERIENLKKNLSKRKFIEKTDFSSILTNISEIITTLYGPFDNIVINNRQAFFTIYKCLYMEIIEKLNRKFDKNLEHFLVDKILINDLINKEKFSEDDEYALDCMMSTFYQLLPTQAFINQVICYDKKNDLLSPSKEYFQPNNQFFEKGFANLSPDNLSNRIYKWTHGKEIWKYKKNEVINELEINEKNPENIKNVLLIHFPIFPLNKNYMESLVEILYNKFQLLFNFYSQILEILDLPKKIKPPKKINDHHKYMYSGENFMLEKSLETLRFKENDENKENLKNLSLYNDQETNTDHKSTMKIKNLQQCNQVFSIDKTQKNNIKKDAKKNTLKKSIIQKKNQETSTNLDFNNLKIEGLERLKKNSLNLIFQNLKDKVKILLNSAFSQLSKNRIFQIKKEKEIKIKKKRALDKVFQTLRIFISNCDYFNKHKCLQTIKKFAKQRIKNEIMSKIKLRKTFNILYENFVANRRRILGHHEKMIKSKVFFYLLRMIYNNKKVKESIKKLINFYSKKQMQTYLNKWKAPEVEFDNEFQNYSRNKTFKSNSNTKSSFNYSKLRKLLDEKKDFSISYNEKIENYTASNLGNKPRIRDHNTSKTCKCKHYFRKCHACESVKFS